MAPGRVDGGLLGSPSAPAGAAGGGGAPGRGGQARGPSGQAGGWAVGSDPCRPGGGREGGEKHECHPHAVPTPET